jgi:UDP-2-acetamido-3-amino-2,3-dideoxy-glucuronate N-acetyltransferase
MSTKIESTAIIEDGAIIGDNCYIGHFALIRSGARIGDFCEIRAHTFIAPHSRIGNGSNIYQLSTICQYAIIEENVFIGPNTVMANTKKISYRRDFECEPQGPYIEYGARIGAGVTLCPGVRIGRNSTVGAGSVVVKDVPEATLYVGNPAKFLRNVPVEEWL